jgi:PKD repeat protein
MKTLFLLISLVLFLVSCQKENETTNVNSDFSISDTLLGVGENLEILNLSDSNSTLYFWDFGDGSSSSEKAPKHYFSSPGVYDIKLRVTDNSGNSDSTLRTIRVGNRFVYEIIINQLAIKKWYPSFGNWDADSIGINALPDVFFSISEQNEPTLYETETIYNLTTNKLPLSFKIPDIKINPAGMNITGILLNDKDGLTFETLASNQMSGVSFSNYTYDKVNHTGEFEVSFYSSYTVKYKIK